MAKTSLLLVVSTAIIFFLDQRLNSSWSKSDLSILVLYHVVSKTPTSCNEAGEKEWKVCVKAEKQSDSTESVQKGVGVMVLPKRSFYDIINFRTELVCIHYRPQVYANIQANFTSTVYDLTRIFFLQMAIKYQLDILNIFTFASWKVILWKSCST